MSRVQITIPALATIQALAVFAQPVSAAPIPVATNLPSTFTFAGPPPGFDVLHATDAELDAYGFPPRPPLTRGKERARWERAMSHAKNRIMPVLVETHLRAGPPRHPAIASGGATSTNWSGGVLLTNANGYGPGAFVTAAAAYNIPVANQANGACTGSWDYLFTWVGIDGWTSDQVFQAGTESDAYCSAGNSQQFYSAWYEWYPNNEVRIGNLAVAGGDVMVAYVDATGPTTGTATLINGTSGNYVVVSFTAPAGITLKGNSAEWITERPSENNVLATLTNYAADWMSDATAQQYNNYQNFTFGAPPYGAQTFGVTMLDNQNAPISYMTPLGGSAFLFQVSGSAE